jgi:hypothetical protein
VKVVPETPPEGLDGSQTQSAFTISPLLKITD